jgi:hypothetical protein
MEIFDSGRFLAQLCPKIRSTGLVLQCWLRQKLALHLDSKAISWLREKSLGYALFDEVLASYCIALRRLRSRSIFGRAPADLKIRPLLEAKSFVRGPKIELPGFIGGPELPGRL